MTRSIVALLCLSLLTPGCAHTLRSAPADNGVRHLSDRTPLVDFARHLPPGTTVRARIESGRTIRGTLIKTTDLALVIQPRGRIAEPLVEVPFGRLVSVEQERPGTGTGKAIAIGAAAGAGAALGTMMILFAIFSG